MGFAKLIAGIAAGAVALEGAYALAAGASSLVRPPGSCGERDFMARCVKCGKCIEACPYKAIRAAGADAGAAVGTPMLEPESRACRLCPDFPCVAACPTGALRDVAEKHDVDMGYVKINENTCIAFKGMRCEVCYRVCPLIDEAISIEYRAMENDAIHAKFIPTIDKDACTGCGLCVQRCVVREPKVAMRIVSIAEQEKKGK